MIYRIKETHKQGEAFEPSWAHTVNEPLTIHFVGGFFFGARNVPGFEEKGWWEFSPFSILVKDY